MPYSLMYEISLVRSCGGVKEISEGSTKGYWMWVDVMSASVAVHRRERVVVDAVGVRGRAASAGEPDTVQQAEREPGL